MSTTPQAGGAYRRDPSTGTPVLVERTEPGRHIDARKPGVAQPEPAPIKKRADKKE